MKLSPTLLIPLVFAACGDQPQTSEPQVPAQIAVSAAQTTAVVGATVPVTATVRDSKGNGVAGVSVAFALQTPTGSVTPASAQTDAQGQAHAAWTLGTTAGTQQLVVTTTGLTGTAAITATAAAASALSKISLDNQEAQVGSALAPVIVKVADAYGNAVSGQRVTFTVLSGGGHVNPASDTTNSQGQTSTVWTLGSNAGTQQIRASAAAGLTVDYTAIARIGGETLNLAPAEWTLPPAKSVRFHAWTATMADAGTRVQWSVNGIPGGDAIVGRITSDGVYTAPSGNFGVNATIGAASAFTTAATARANVRPDLQAATRVAYAQLTPGVIDVTSTDSAEFIVVANGYTQAVTLTPLSGGSIALEPWASNMFRVKLAPQRILQGYTTGDLHVMVGRFSIDGVSGQANLSVNVRDATVVEHPFSVIADDAQHSDYILNIRYDGTDVRTKTEMLARLYQYRGDDFDFVSIVDGVSGYANRYYSGIRNNTTGLGAATYDNGAQYGSAARLQGVITFPLPEYFDGASTAYVHEIGHRWISYTKGPFSPGPHWPPSDLARDVMGFNIPGSSEGGTFNRDVSQRSDGTWELVCTGVAPTGVFSDLSLYLMGLVDAADVGTHSIMTDWTQQSACGSTINVTRVGVSDVIALNGVRSPAFPNAPKDFRMATIVLSKGRLLTPSEMSFYSHMAARAELQEAVLVTEGFLRATSNPFFVATGGRATLTTRMW